MINCIAIVLNLIILTIYSISFGSIKSIVFWLTTTHCVLTPLIGDGALDAPPAPLAEEVVTFDEEGTSEEGALLEEEASFVIEEVTVDEETATEETEFEADVTETVFESSEEEVAAESSSNVAIAGAQGLIYTGEPQALLSVTEDNAGCEYSLDGENFSSEIPTGTNAGDYTVYIKNEAGDEVTTVTVSIAKADVIFTPPTPNTTE